MIYIHKHSGTISVPRHTFNETGFFTLIVTSNISDTVVLVEDGEDISTNSLYYKFAIHNLEKLNTGEYTYRLYNNQKMVETGLLTYGNYNRVIIENNTFNKEKKQYNG